MATGLSSVHPRRSVQGPPATSALEEREQYANVGHGGTSWVRSGRPSAAAVLQGWARHPGALVGFRPFELADSCLHQRSSRDRWADRGRREA